MLTIGSSYGYFGWAFDRLDEKYGTTPGAPLASILSAAGVDLTGIDTTGNGPTQLVNTLISGIDVSAIQAVVNKDNAGMMAAMDKDVSGPLLVGYGNGGGNTVYRLRDGVERFMITDINNAGSANISQSAMWVMLDQFSTSTAGFNHIPGGSNVLYMDGHAEFVRYQEKNGTAPVVGTVGRVMGLFGAMI